MFIEHVHDAARLLDHQQPGWADRVDSAQLDLSSSTKCVLGQVYARYVDSSFYTSGYYYGGSLLMNYNINWNLFADRKYEHAWVAEIETRRAKPAVVAVEEERELVMA